MPARRHHFGKCGHFGFGGECHRCAQADALDAQAQKAKEGPKAAALKAEATRLRAPRTP